MGVVALAGLGKWPSLSSHAIVTSQETGGFITLGMNINGRAYFKIDDSGLNVIYSRNFDPDWAGVVGGTPGTLYEVYFTTISGVSPSSGSITDDWIGLNFNRSWSYPTQLGLNSAVWQVQIRTTGSSNVLAVARYTISVTGV